MIQSVRKTLPKNSELAKRIDAFAELYQGDQAQIQNEERIAELIGLLSSKEFGYDTLTKPAKNVVIDFFKRLAKRFNIDLGSDFGDTDASVIDLINTISRKTAVGEEITEQEVSFLESNPYSEGVPVNATENNVSEPRQNKIIYKDVPFVEEITVTSMQEFVEAVEGRLFTVTSDATKVGFDSKGERVDGGFGYTALPENIEGDVGFASLDMKTARSTMAKIKKQFKTGEKVGVMIMVQNPSATIGNIYGGKYIGRGLAQIQNADPKAYEDIYKSIEEFVDTNKSVVKAVKKNKSREQLLELLRNPSSYTEAEFAKEWIADTSFDARRELLKSMIITSQETRTNKSTPSYKISLKDAGFTMQDFLMEYGDIELLGENNLMEDKGGFLVGGFVMEVPSNVNKQSDAVEGRGFTHPQFNGKLPSVGNHVMFDGLYPIQENLIEFAKPESQLIGIKKGEANERVRELAKTKDIFLDKFTNEDSENYVAPEDRGYTHMKSTAKTIFKEQNPDLVEPKAPNLGANTARGMATPIEKRPAKGTKFTPSIRQQTIETQRVIKEVDGIIEKSKQRGRKFSEIPKNVLSYLQGTKLYENATDIQREQLFRDVRKKLGIKEKAAPSVKKILGVDPSKKVTMSQKQLVVQRIRDINKGAKDALRAFKSASTQVAKDVKEMVKSGNISTKQSAAIIKKFANVNMLKEKSIENFVEYMGRVFRDANYAENIAKANKLRKNAKKNIKRKIGLASAVSGDLQRIFAINPNLIPESVFNKYMELASEFGERKTVLNLSEMSETAKVVKDILDAVDLELSKIPELQDSLESFENKVVDEETGQLDYAKTIKKMLDEEVISEADAEIMTKYKSEIQPKKVKEVKSEEEIEAERQEAIKSISEAPALKVSELSSEYERQQGDKFNFLINSVDALDGLSLQELKQVEALIDNINNGYFPHLAQVMVEKMSANLKSNTMVDAIGNAKMLPLSKRIGAFKSMFTKKGAVLEMIRRNPLYYIDQLFGDFYGKPLYESLFEDTAKAIEQYEVAFKKVSSKIDKAEDAVYKSFKNNGNKTLMSKFKQMVYMIQLEYDSNLGNPEVNQAKAFIEKNIESIKDQNLEVYGASDAEMLQEILDKFTNKETGEIDAELLYESFNKAEKASIKTIQEVNAELGPIAEQTAAIIRGESIIPRNNYVHLNTINKEGFDAMEFNAQKHRESLQPSTKAKSLIKRTGAISALNFDVYKSATKGAKGVLLDFYMTEPVRTSKRTLNSTEKKLKESGDYNQEKRDIFNGIRKGWEESIDNQFNKAYQKSVFVDRVLDWINRNGYRAILASAPRFIAELSSNTAFAMIANPKEFTSGAKIGVGFLNSDAAPEAMKNLKSTNVTRIYPNGDMSGRMIDTNLMSGEGAKEAKSAKNRYRNRVDQVWSVTGSKWVQGVGSLADFLISTPDKIVMRPMWFGTFSVEFEKLTGKKPNLDKIAENDADYMSQYKDQLKESTKKADEASVMAGAASNPFMGTLRGVSKPDASFAAKAYNRFNNFMTTFLIYEYVTARTGVMNAIGRGNLSKKKGAALLGATTSRMVGYTLMSSIMSDLFFGEEEEDEKDFDQQLGQAIASSVFSMGLGRDFGNATKAVINQFITEPVNEEFLTGLRNGDYNVYKDGLSYKVIPEGKMGRGVDFYDALVNLAGPYSPLIKSLRFATSAFTKPDAKTEETQSKYDKEKKLAMLELLGHLGVIPFYKDLRTLARKQIYKDMNNMSKAKDDSVSTTPGYFRRSTKKKRRSRKRSSGKRRAFID
jgi:hypothetical protein